MAELINIDLGKRSRRLRVDTLVTLRGLALLGQAIALVVTYFGLRFSLPLGPCLLVIAASAGLNIGSAIAADRARAPSKACLRVNAIAVMTVAPRPVSRRRRPDLRGQSA